MTKSKVALLFSGGPDSTTLLYDLVAQGKDVVTVTYNFGEAEGENEQSAAARIANEIGVVNHHFDFSGPLREFYELPQPQFLRMAMMRSSESGPVSQSEDVQPFGSTIALMLTASWAVKNGIETVYYAVHADDSHFEDNHQSYFDLLGQVTQECEGSTYGIKFETPYLGIRKYEVVQKGTDLGVPFELTWSCAAGGEEHCGKCAPCVNRHGSFSILGLNDPVSYMLDPSAVVETVKS